MTAFDWIASTIVVISLIYISFVLTVRDWLIALRKGQAVTLLPERGGRPRPFWMQVAMIILGLAICVPLFTFGWVPLFALSSNVKFTTGMIGLILYLAGFVFVLWARRTLGKYWGLSTSLQVKLLDEHQLVRSGPYAFMRHPMYFGWWAAMFGLTLLYPVWVVLFIFVLSVVSYTGRARLEEAALAERFGEQWVEYQKHTKFIIPFIY
jgi:protein-S-isoprenylcysteine O-methyltransferase Ste14